MLYFTSPHETAFSIAEKFTDRGVGALAKQIAKENSDSRAAKLFPGPYYAPNYPIWIPLGSNQPSLRERKAIVNEMGWLESDVRYEFRQLQGTDFDMTHLLYAASLSDAMNASAAEVGLLVPKDPEAPTSLLEYLESGVGHLLDSHAEQIRHLADDIKDLNQSFREYAENIGTVAERDMYTLAKTKLVRFHQLHNDSIAKYHIDGKRGLRTTKTLNAIRKRRGYEIADTQEAKSIFKCASRLEFFSRGLIALDAAQDTYEVHEIYRKHGHWIKTVIEDAGELVALFKSASWAERGLAVLFGLTSEGWASLLLITSLGIGITELLSWAWKDVVEWISKKIPS